MSYVVGKSSFGSSLPALSAARAVSVPATAVVAAVAVSSPGNANEITGRAASSTSFTVGSDASCTCNARNDSIATSTPACCARSFKSSSTDEKAALTSSMTSTHSSAPERAAPAKASSAARAASRSTESASTVISGRARVRCVDARDVDGVFDSLCARAADAGVGRAFDRVAVVVDAREAAERIAGRDRLGVRSWNDAERWIRAKTLARVRVRCV